MGVAAIGAVLSAVSVSSFSLPAIAHPVAPPLPPDPSTISPELTVLGHSDLGSIRKGNNGEVAVIGNTAIVASGIQPAGGLRTHMYTPYPCPQSKVKLVNITNPTAPSVVGNIVIPTGVVARDVAAIKVKAIGASPTTYRLLGIAQATCGGAGNLNSRGVAYYDITNPAAPVFKGRYLADREQFLATVDTDGALANDALTWNSNYDSARKTATVELVNPGVAGPISVNVVNPGASTPTSDIVVTLAHDGTNVTSTANDVKNAINANTPAKSLVFVAFTGVTTGTDVMTPTAGPVPLAVNLGPTACPPNCASSQDSVSLAQLADGRVLSTSTEPFATFSQSSNTTTPPGLCDDNGPFTLSNGAGTFPRCAFPSGDVRIADVTDPVNPVQIGDFNPRRSDPAGAPPPVPPASNLGADNPRVEGGFSKNGCRSFTGIMSAELNADGTKAVAAGFDDGLIDINMTPPAGPGTFSESAAAVPNAYIDPNPVGDRDVEGNASFATFGGPTNNLGLLSDQDWIAPQTTVRVDTVAAPGAITPGSYKGCESMWTLFDPEDTAQIYRSLDSQVPGGIGNSVDFVYVGRGCPGDAFMKDSLGNPVSIVGKIAVADRNKSATRQPGIPAAGCSTVDKANQLQQNGAIAVVVDAQQSGGYAFSPDGAPSGASIPLVAIDAPHGVNLITTLCQAPYAATPSTGQCGANTAVTGALVDSAPDGPESPWGALHIMDLGAGTKVGEFRTPRSQQFPPPDLGVYSVHHAVAKGNRAYVAWNSDGIRAIDLTNPALPSEVGHFIPSHTGQPFGHLDDPNLILPTQAYVVGVAIIGPHPKGGCKIAATDIHSGLWILRDPTGSC